MGAAGVLIGLSDNIVRPWVQGSQDHMHPLIVLLAVFGGARGVWFAGVFIGAVVAACALRALDVYGVLEAGREQSPASINGQLKAPSSGVCRE